MTEPRKPLASWKGQDRYFGEVLSSLTGIFLSGGCSWNRCRMCGYKNDRDTCAKDELIDHMKGQILWMQENYAPDEYQLGKIFTSGSVFDQNEVPLEVLDAFGEFFAGKPLIAESRSEYITENALARLLKSRSVLKRRMIPSGRSRSIKETRSPISSKLPRRRITQASA